MSSGLILEKIYNFSRGIRPTSSLSGEIFPFSTPLLDRMTLQPFNDSLVYFGIFLEIIRLVIIEAPFHILCQCISMIAVSEFPGP